MNLKLPKDRSERLRVVGEAMYGQRWRARLAALIGISERLISHWSNKRAPADIDAHLSRAIDAYMIEAATQSGTLVEIRAQLGRSE